MKTKLFVLSLALTFLASQAAPAVQAQRATSDGGWSEVETLSTGEKIVLRMKDGHRFEGKFAGATVQSITLKHNGREMAVSRDSIWRVSRERGRSRLVASLIGAGVGAGVGFAVGGGIFRRSDSVGTAVPVFGAIGAGIGAGAGAGIGKSQSDATIYQAP